QRREGEEPGPERAGPCPPDDCDTPEHEISTPCLDPHCPPHQCVPLAWVRWRLDQPIVNGDIEMIGRPVLKPPPEALTHICTVNCDFVLDCHGVPVDGDHLGGVLPSGDGTRGGTFESWFRVLADDECERRRRDRAQQREEQRRRQREAV